MNTKKLPANKRSLLMSSVKKEIKRYQELNENLRSTLGRVAAEDRIVNKLIERNTETINDLNAMYGEL